MSLRQRWVAGIDLSRVHLYLAGMRALFFALAWLMVVTPAMAKPITILALGDSLTAGYGLAGSESFPAKLQAALRKTNPDITVVNGGISGDTAADGAARFDWALNDDIDALIVELGANDALRGLDPAQMEAALDEIMGKAKAKSLPILLMGMKAPPNMGMDYVARFDGIYPRLAEKHGALLYPFFLDGVAAQASLNQQDGIHPTAKGVDMIVSRTLPMVKQLIERVNGN
jgi:acyl-CoA thioesterase I